MTKLDKILALACLVMAGLGAYGLYREHVAEILLDQQTKAAKTAISAIQTAQNEKNAQAATQIAALQAEKAQVKTVIQIVHDIPQVVPTVTPSEISVVTSAQAEGANKADPTAPPIVADDVVMTKDAAKALDDAANDGQQCRIDFANELAKNSSLTQISAVKDTEIKQRDQALKGGTKMARIKTASKWVTLGGLLGAGVTLYLTHK
jgi:hypothetical protein